MLPLDDAIRSRVVGGDSDVLNSESLLEPVERGDERCPIVGYDFFYRSPST
jgi:hypothetical protein